MDTSQRMTVTVVMSDIRGYSTIAEKADPTALAGQLNEHRAAMNHAIIGSSGTVMQFVGDAVMAVFGAPLPCQDHPDRAVAAALLGSDERLEYTVVGDAVNLTQRLQQWAEPGETVLTEATWESLTSAVHAQALEPAHVQGRDAPVRAYKVPATRRAETGVGA